MLLPIKIKQELRDPGILWASGAPSCPSGSTRFACLNPDQNWAQARKLRRGISLNFICSLGPVALRGRRKVGRASGSGLFRPLEATVSCTQTTWRKGRPRPQLPNPLVPSRGQQVYKMEKDWILELKLELNLWFTKLTECDLAVSNCFDGGLHNGGRNKCISRLLWEWDNMWSASQLPLPLAFPHPKSETASQVQFIWHTATWTGFMNMLFPSIKI